MIVAEELGISPRDVTTRIGDTQFPIGPASGGSCTTGSIAPAARNAAFAAKKELWAAIGEENRSLSFRAACAKLKTEQVAGRATRTDDYAQPGHKRMGIGGYGGVQFAEVSVDTQTGIIKVERGVAGPDCARPVNPL